MTAKELFELAKKAHAEIKKKPYITRAELNHELKVGTNTGKISSLSTVLSNMLTLGQIRKHFDQESCSVSFWLSEGSDDMGDKLRDLEHDPVDYLKPYVEKVSQNLDDILASYLLKTDSMMTHETIHYHFRTHSITGIIGRLSGLWRKGIVSKHLDEQGTLWYWHKHWDHLFGTKTTAYEAPKCKFEQHGDVYELTRKNKRVVRFNKDEYEELQKFVLHL